ncbi:MAG: EF-P beta-lysylation protein EpmB [Nevskiales bacterium]
MTPPPATRARILPEIPRARQPSWRAALQQAVTDPAELLNLLELGPELLPAARQAAALFPLRVPRGYVARMHKGDPRDPLLLQVLPLAAELDAAPGFGRDAVGDLPSARGDGVLQKYRGRALLITTGACGVHCRFCFRRHFPYADHTAARAGWQPALERVAADTSLEEVILSGGDPLSLSDRRLAELTDQLDGISHLKRLRIHTRQPVVLPERVDAELLAWLGRGRLQKIVVIHANHAHELDRAVALAMRAVATTGATLLNQSVLLRGVNDSVAALRDLSQRLFACGVLPYYLHLLDRVQGSAHFEVPESSARELHHALAAELPGYLVPRLVREEPGQPGKTLL